MKKLFIIIILALLQCACATSREVSGSPSMLGFDAISAEITVGYENLEEQYDPSQALASNLEN